MIKNFLPVFSLATVEGEVPDIIVPGGGAMPPSDIDIPFVPEWELFFNSCEKVLDYGINIFQCIISNPILVLFLAGSIIPLGLSIIRIMKNTVD